jgi:hypothetical protein
MFRPLPCANQSQELAFITGETEHGNLDRLRVRIFDEGHRSGAVSGSGFPQCRAIGSALSGTAVT